MRFVFLIETIKNMLDILGVDPIPVSEIEMNAFSGV